MSIRIVAVALTLVASGCRRDVAPQHVAQAFCADSIEERALLCSRNAARRSGETLFVRVDGGKESPFVDRGGETGAGYAYEGRVGRLGYHLIRSMGGEVPPYYLLMSPSTGKFGEASDVPIVSPEGERFAVGAPYWEDCELRAVGALEIWRLSADMPVPEFQFQSWDCGPKLGWAATDLRWRSADTLEFIQHDAARPEGQRESVDSAHRKQRPMLLVHESTGWRITAPPR